MSSETSTDASETEQFAYDVGYREAMADIITIKLLLMDNRPLEALNVAVEAVERRHIVDTDTEQGDGT